MKVKVYKMIILGVTVAFFLGLSVVGLFIYTSFDLPDVKELVNYSPPIPSQILSRDGEVLATFGREKREMVDIKDIPQIIIDAFLSSEDNNFYHHKGIDYMGILRAILADIKAGRLVQGGSTITQQVAKSLLLGREKSFTRKFKDIMLAQKIEEVFSKEEILYLYLNHVYLGGGYYGVKAAFQGYFDKELPEVTLGEAALVVGLLVAPGKYSPYIGPEQARKRQLYVLGRMYEDGKITQEAYEEAKEERIKIRLRNLQENFKGGHFTEWIRQRVQALVGEEEFLTQGIRIVTTLDWNLQQQAEKDLFKGVKEIDKRQGYIGPKKHLNSDEEIDQFIINFREQFFKEKSHYFLLTPDGKKEYELSLSLDQWGTLKQSYVQKKLGKNIKHYRPGVIHEQLLDFLEAQTMYTAVVEDLDAQQQMIYASLGGAKVMIPYEFYRWAHKRSFNENPHYYSYITNPGLIVKKGDVIMVTLRHKDPQPLWDFLNATYRSKLSDSELINQLKEEKFLLAELDQEPEVEGALLAMDSKNGEILSMVGGRDFSKSQFNRAIQALRQSGSAFKPILYASALERGYNPATIIMDTPEALGGVDETSNWKPRNYDGKFNGPMTFRHALEVSRNIPSVKIAENIGLDKIQQFVHRIGLNVEVKDLSMALGSVGMTLVDLVSTYALFGNGGKKVYPKSVTSITDRYGNSFQLADENRPDNKTGITPKGPLNQFLSHLTQEQVYDGRLAYLMTNILRGVVQRGTGTQASSLGAPLAGKTGTTNNYVDAWFIGFSSNVTLGVWTGRDDNKTLGWPETGAKAALPIWVDVMRHILPKYGQTEFSIPNGIIHVPIDREAGRAVPPGTPGAFIEAFVTGSEPGEGSNITPTDDENGDESKDVFDEDDFYRNQ